VRGLALERVLHYEIPAGKPAKLLDTLLRSLVSTTKIQSSTK
jgi:hypothetical protein